MVAHWLSQKLLSLWENIPVASPTSGSTWGKKEAAGPTTHRAWCLAAEGGEADGHDHLLWCDQRPAGCCWTIMVPPSKAIYITIERGYNMLQLPGLGLSRVISFVALWEINQSEQDLGISGWASESSTLAESLQRPNVASTCVLVAPGHIDHGKMTWDRCGKLGISMSKVFEPTPAAKNRADTASRWA